MIWLLDRFPNIRYFVDLHSYGETILHSWGSDENQSDEPRMNFRNRAYDGKRGLIHDDVYREHMPAADEKTAVRMGRYMAAALERVRGRKYRVQQSVGLYPTAASTDDYAYSRHLVDPKKGKIIAFTMEWGRSRASTPFHPPYPEMRKVMREVSAALLECCLRSKSKTVPRSPVTLTPGQPWPGADPPATVTRSSRAFSRAEPSINRRYLLFWMMYRTSSMTR